MSLLEWMSLVAVCVLGAVSPGPSLLVVVNQTLNQGRLHGVLTALSHGATVGLWAICTLFGLSKLLLLVPSIQTLMTLFAVAYLLYLARASWRGSRLQLAASKKSSVSIAGALADGAVIAAFNPKLVLFFLALFTPFIKEGASFGDSLLLIITPWLTDTLWYLLVAMVISGHKGLAFLERHQQRINRCLALTLVLIALVMLYGLY